MIRLAGLAFFGVVLMGCIAMPYPQSSLDAAAQDTTLHRWIPGLEERLLAKTIHVSYLFQPINIFVKGALVGQIYEIKGPEYEQVYEKLIKETPVTTLLFKPIHETGEVKFRAHGEFENFSKLTQSREETVLRLYHWDHFPFNRPLITELHLETHEVRTYRVREQDYRRLVDDVTP